MEELTITKNYLKYTSEIPYDKKSKIISKYLYDITNRTM